MPANFPPLPVYPDAIDTDRTLYLVYNTTETVTTSDNGAWSDEIEIRPVASDKNEIWADNGFANISGELLYYNSVEKNASDRVVKLKGCVRNLGGEETHFNPEGSEVRSFVIAEHHNQLVLAICEIEKFLGAIDCDDTDTLNCCLEELDIPEFSDECPGVEFDYIVLSEDVAEGTTISYTITTFGNFTDFRLDFGDGTFTTVPASGTKVYPVGTTIDPVVTMRNNLCETILTGVQRSIDDEPQPPVDDNDLVIPVPSIEIPSFNIPTITPPSIDLTIPPFVGQCIDLDPVGFSIGDISLNIDVPSIISVVPPIPSVITIIDNIPSIINVSSNIPSVISITPVDIPTVISITPVDIPSFISISPIDIPSFISITPISIPSVISIIPPSFPTVISVIPPELRSISVDPVEVRVELSVAPAISIIPPDIPTVISVIPPDIPDIISFGPVDIPSIISFGPIDIPSIISFGPIDIPSAIAVIDDIPEVIEVIDSLPTQIFLLINGTIPTEISLIVPSINPVQVEWGTPPTISCQCVVGCPVSSTPAQMSPLHLEELDIAEDGIPLANLEVDYEFAGIPSKIIIEPPEELPKIGVDASGIPRRIKLIAPTLPEKITVEGMHELPSVIQFKIEMPTEMSIIRLDVTDLPKSIPLTLDRSLIPSEIKLVSDSLPSVISIEHDIPSIIEVEGIPTTITVEGMPDVLKVQVEEPDWTFKVEPAEITLKIDMDKLIRTDDQGRYCFGLVPCEK